MSDPAVAQDPSAYQKLARESKDITPVVERYRAYKDALAELAKVQEMAKAETDPELREMAHEESARPRGEARRPRRRDPPAPDPQGPERREERPPRDPRRHRRRRGRALRGRGLPHVLALRRAAGLEDRRDLREPHGTGRAQGSHRPDRGRPGLLEAPLRERRPPRAARARHRGLGPHPHLGRHGGGAARGRGGGRQDRGQGPAHRHLLLLGPRAARASTPPTPRCASPTCPRTPWSPARTRRARSRTARRP